MPKTNDIDVLFLDMQSDEPDLVVAAIGDNSAWDRFTELAELEHQHLMNTDPRYRRHIARARVLWAAEQIVVTRLEKNAGTRG